MGNNLSFHIEVLSICAQKLARNRRVCNVFAFHASRGAIHIHVDTLEKWYGQPLVGFSLSNPLSARADSARRLIRFIRNEATHGGKRDFSHRYKAREL